MTDMPERMWADEWGEWYEHDLKEEPLAYTLAEYVRADLYAKMVDDFDLTLENWRDRSAAMRRYAAEAYWYAMALSFAAEGQWKYREVRRETGGDPRRPNQRIHQQGTP